MIDYLKKVLRERLSEWKWRELWSLKAKPSFTRLCVHLIKLLPPKYAVSIKEKLKLVGRLDYEHAPVLMNLESVKQLARLHACKKEPETVTWLETQLREGDVFYDIGANVGAYSFLASSITSRETKIYAFEPSFTNFAQLCQNVFLNNCQGKVIPLQVALSNRTALEDFNYHSLFPGAAMHSLGEAIDYAGRPFQPVYVQQVLSFRIDDLVEQFKIEPPDLIKLDVDGTELSVLQGLGDILLRPQLRSIIVEVNEELDQMRKIVVFLEAKGFQLEVEQKHRAGNIANLIFAR